MAMIEKMPIAPQKLRYSVEKFLDLTLFIDLAEVND
jgi:hypothetical protein